MPFTRIYIILISARLDLFWYRLNGIGAPKKIFNIFSMHNLCKN